MFRRGHKVIVNKIEKRICCGCGACKDACAINCISMKLDEEGFAYPVVDEEHCLNCGKCSLVCPNFQTCNRSDNKTILYFFNKIRVTCHD